jgi:hypothetical protein
VLAYLNNATNIPGRRNYQAARHIQKCVFLPEAYFVFFRELCNNNPNELLLHAAKSVQPKMVFF